MKSALPYVSKDRWPVPLGHMEKFITSTGHDLTVDHSKGERIEIKYAELQQKLGGIPEAAKLAKSRAPKVEHAADLGRKKGANPK